MNGAQRAKIIKQLLSVSDIIPKPKLNILNAVRVQQRWGHNRDREYPLFLGRWGSPIEIASRSPRQSISHRERALEREEGAWGEDVVPLALLSQLLEREVHLRP